MKMAVLKALQQMMLVYTKTDLPRSLFLSSLNLMVFQCFKLLYPSVYFLVVTVVKICMTGWQCYRFTTKLHFVVLNCPSVVLQ